MKKKDAPNHVNDCPNSEESDQPFIQRKKEEWLTVYQNILCIQVHRYGKGLQTSAAFPWRSSLGRIPVWAYSLRYCLICIKVNEKKLYKWCQLGIWDLILDVQLLLKRGTSYLCWKLSHHLSLTACRSYKSLQNSTKTKIPLLLFKNYAFCNILF